MNTITAEEAVEIRKGVEEINYQVTNQYLTAIYDQIRKVANRHGLSERVGFYLSGDMNEATRQRIITELISKGFMVREQGLGIVITWGNTRDVEEQELARNVLVGTRAILYHNIEGGYANPPY